MSIRSYLILFLVIDLILALTVGWQLFKFGFIALLVAVCYVHARWYR